MEITFPIFSIYLLLLSCSSVRFSEGSLTNSSYQCNHYYRNLSMDNVLVTDNNTGLPVDDISQCLLACNSDSNCMSFFFNKMTSECFLSGVCVQRNMSTMQQSTEMGWSYFQNFCGCYSCCDTEWIRFISSTKPGWRKLHDMCNCSSCCDDGWTQFENSCFFFDLTKRSWDSSKTNCEGLNASLAEPRTQALNSFLIQEAKTVSKALAWIGADDVVEEGTWKWATTGEELDYTNWIPGKPYNYGNTDCLGFYNDGTWNDFICSTLIEAICQKDVEDNTY